MIIRDYMKRNVFSIPATATIAEAAQVFRDKHVGLLPVLDQDDRPVGVLGLQEMLALAMPDFVKLLEDVDFVHDFGAVEASQPSQEMLMRSVTTIMRPATTVKEECGLLRAYAIMRKRFLHDLPIVSQDGRLVGIASRVDIGVAILNSWQYPKAGG